MCIAVLGMVEARSVDVKNRHTYAHTRPSHRTEDQSPGTGGEGQGRGGRRRGEEAQENPDEETIDANINIIRVEGEKSLDRRVLVQ